MEKFPHRGPEKDPSEIQEEKRLGLLEALSPSSARIFRELQNPSIPRDEFFRKIAEYNDSRSKQPERRGAYQTVSAEISPTRSVRVDFSRAGWVDLQGTDFSQE